MATAARRTKAGHQFNLPWMNDCGGQYFPGGSYFVILIRPS
jgi:hypothetical protein